MTRPRRAHGAVGSIARATDKLGFLECESNN
jgi:hypothetical protein